MLGTRVTSAVFVALAATGSALAPSRAVEEPLAGFEDYRRAAGTHRGDTLDVALDVRTVRWRPEGEGGAELPVLTFVERGRAPRVPGPMLRVSAGTTVRVGLRNDDATRLVVFGLQDHAVGAAHDSVVLDPGADTTVAFRVRTPGTYYYWGRRRTGAPSRPVPPERAAAVARSRWMPGGTAAEGPLVGALIVDPAGTFSRVPSRRRGSGC